MKIASNGALSMFSQPLLNRAIAFPKELISHLDEIETPIGKILNVLIATLVFLSCLIFVLGTYPIGTQFRAVLDEIDEIILVLFTIEYILRFLGAEQKLKHLVSPYALIDLLAILPLLLGVADVRFLRIFRWFRILRLIRFLKGKILSKYVSADDSVILIRIGFTLFSIIFVYSGLIYQVEHPINPQAFNTFLDATYFAIATMTTVGFGDVTPISELGRLLTVLMILSGITLIPWQVGDLIKQLVKTSAQIEQPCPSCSHAFHDADAKFCKRCGTSLFDSSA